MNRKLVCLVLSVVLFVGCASVKYPESWIYDVEMTEYGVKMKVAEGAYEDYWDGVVKIPSWLYVLDDGEQVIKAKFGPRPEPHYLWEEVWVEVKAGYEDNLVLTIAKGDYMTEEPTVSRGAYKSYTNWDDKKWRSAWFYRNVKDNKRWGK